MRYIDADKLCEALKSMASVQPTFKQSTILGVVSSIENFPAADVVPMAEVENLKVLLEMNEKAYKSLRELYHTDTDALVEARRKTEVEVAREIFEEIEKLSHRFMNDKHYIFGDMVWDIAELKKKYTEEKKDDNQN